jgi:hypothetical protein
MAFREVCKIGVCVSLAVAMSCSQVSLSLAQAPANANPPASQNTTVSNFLADPAALLRRFQSGGPDMASQVKDLVITDAAAVPVILNLLSTANANQKRAVGQGLAEAAKVLVRSDQARAVDVQQRVAALTDPVLRVSFLAALGDTQLGGPGAGPGGGGAGGGVGGPTTALPLPGGGTSGVQDIRAGAFGTPNFNYTSAVSSVSGYSSNPGGSNFVSSSRSSNSPVSP